MDMQLKLNKLILEDLKRCEELYAKLSKQAVRLPAGSLVIRCGTYYRAVRENGKQYFAMLTGDENDLLHSLKLKRYITKALPILQKRITLDKTFLQNNILYNPEEIRNSLPVQYHDNADLDIYLKDDVNPQNWAAEKYKQNPIEITIPHFTAGGLKTRSKSEELIGSKLEENNFIFKYEPELVLGNRHLYPDFAVLLPNRRRIVYWEHLGLIDDPDYVLRNLNKLEAYAEHGIYLGLNLIITYETKDRPLTIVDVEQKIRELYNMDRI